MVLSLNKELLSWYLITLKLRETVESSIPKSPTGVPLIEFPQSPAGSPQTPQEESKSPNSEWIISIRKNLNKARQDDAAYKWLKSCIYKVPRCLKEGDEKAYEPQIISLGPYHHGKSHLRQMDQHKWRCLDHMLRRNGQDITLYLDSIRKLEKRARLCYEGTILMSSNEFVEMMVLDGCFMLEVFLGAAGGFLQHEYPMLSSMHTIRRDMIMLENQIPLFVLDRLFKLQISDSVQKGMVSKLALKFFHWLTPSDDPLAFDPLSNLAFDPLSDLRGFHCLDVFRRNLLGPRGRWSQQANRVADMQWTRMIHCVMELREAGIEFEKRKTDRFWDIKFKNGVLQIPGLLIQDSTKSLFLNLIAFEQCHLDCGDDITTYIMFMDNLINSPKDVAHLHYCGIIENLLGSDEEVADLFNRLGQEVLFDINNNYLVGLSQDVNQYYYRRWNAWRASLMHNHCSSPWAIISILAGLVLLILTMTQTFYTVYAYYRR